MSTREIKTTFIIERVSSIGIQLLNFWKSMFLKRSILILNVFIHPKIILIYLQLTVFYTAKENISNWNL